MLSINTNLSSIIAQNSMKTSTDKLNQAIERMSTGYKINHAKDNAANYAISTDMTTKIGAYQVAEDNCAQGLDMVSTASESLYLIQDKLERLRALATQASNGTYGTQSKQAINAEANALVDEIERIFYKTDYNGIQLFGETSNTFALKRASPATTSYEGIDMVALTDSVTTIKSGTVYSIENAQQLQHLANLVNLEGANTTGATFVLTSDIDLSGINWVPIGNYGSNTVLRFYGTFDGNGHTISNLTIKDLSNDVQGLFGYTDNAEIKNVYLKDVDIKSTNAYIASLVGRAMNGSVINNCHVISGKINTSNHSVGGLLGVCVASEVKNSSANVEIVGGQHTGGLFGAASNGSIIENCFSQGTLTSTEWKCGGIIGSIYSTITIRNCYSTMDITNHARTGGIVGDLGGVNNTLENLYFGGTCSSAGYYGAIAGYAYESTNFTNCYYNVSTDSTLPGNGGIGLTVDEIASGTAFDSFKNVTNDFGENLWVFNADGTPSLNTGYKKTSFVPSNKGNGSVNLSSDSIIFQIGLDSKNSSQIEFCTKFSLVNIDELRNIGYDTTINFLNIIDENLLGIKDKQTDWGAVQNRLESALDEISTQYENLVSSRSTLCDADIADLSSTYIQQQILQQAAATLMSTANQNPAIALQLI